MEIDSRHVDETLATTRAVRRRLDLERPVDNQLLLDCIDLAEQAPTGGNLGSRRWIIVRDQARQGPDRRALPGDRVPFVSPAAERLRGTGHPQERVLAPRCTSSSTSPKSPPSSSRRSSAVMTAAAAPACSTR